MNGLLSERGPPASTRRPLSTPFARARTSCTRPDPSTASGRDTRRTGTRVSSRPQLESGGFELASSQSWAVPEQASRQASDGPRARACTIGLKRPLASPESRATRTAAGPGTNICDGDAIGGAPSAARTTKNAPALSVASERNRCTAVRSRSRETAGARGADRRRTPGKSRWPLRARRSIPRAGASGPEPALAPPVLTPKT